MHIYKLDYTKTFIDLENEKLDKKIFKKLDRVNKFKKKNTPPN